MNVIESFTGWDYLRIICGLFFLPHLADKVFRPAGPIGFFTAAGLLPANLYRYAGIVIELIVSGALIFNFHAREAAIVAALFLAAAALALVKVSKREWLWNRGGSEYTVFWLLCCLVVAAGP